MRSLILSLLVLQLLLPGAYSEAAERKARKPLMCRNPKAKEGQSIQQGCSTATCGRMGKKAVWQQCAQLALEKTVKENQQKIDRNHESLKSILEILDQPNCCPARAPATTWAPASTPIEGIARFIYHEPSLIFNLQAERQKSSDINQTIESWKDGFATESSTCVKATAGASIEATFTITRRAVSSAKIQNKALKLTRHIKERYIEEFHESVSNSATGHDSIWRWLGIGSSGERSNTDRTVYKEDQKGLDEARDELTEELTNNLDEHVQISAKASATGIGPIASYTCIYFAVQQVKLTNGEILNIVISDPKTWVTADERTGEKVPNKGISGLVTDLE